MSIYNIRWAYKQYNAEILVHVLENRVLEKSCLRKKKPLEKPRYIKQYSHMIIEVQIIRFHTIQMCYSVFVIQLHFIVIIYYLLLNSIMKTKIRICETFLSD